MTCGRYVSELGARKIAVYAIAELLWWADGRRADGINNVMARLREAETFLRTYRLILAGQHLQAQASKLETDSETS